MLVVHGFAPMPPLASPSPFCLKLETWLRMAGLPYEAKGDFNPFAAPKGKAPYVTLEDGATLSDSQHIIEVLSARHEVTLDHGLTAAQRGLATTLRRTVEDHLYFAVLWHRWVQDDGFAILRGAYFGGDAWPLRVLVPPMARRGATKTVYYQGTGRHTPEEILAGAVEDLDALSAILGDQSWFLGDQPRSVDAAIYGCVGNVLYGPFPDGLQAAVRERANLVAWSDRIRARYWS